MIQKILVSDFRKLGIACKNLGAVSRSMVMDCIKAMVNGWGMRFVVMTFYKFWTLILYVLRRQLKTVRCLFVSLLLLECMFLLLYSLWRICLHFGNGWENDIFWDQVHSFFSANYDFHFGCKTSRKTKFQEIS